ncbi:MULTISPECIES: transcription-repair coupling factor [unclassified Oceanispirochaeta]|uniref:transcription-repair coupling factor n=1 Tax=unclassified Oceanispirochaeta TaxID=2635722 RepID=UPI000E095214|nr:transcription-repair coupling factor [Oceanispirochaeta sp. M1]MBF9015672.1 transcription-repair coupling factor [Oceanispirochaeta sp. M2]NPD73446.1 transcription-repair coupling factor [Oceanispirochaeta sp. M1]RDG30919.1 transcription-repair coupling factor [Oceanispirochaeta sp. M1]
MITLYQNTIREHFTKNTSYQAVLDSMNNGSYPVNISGIRGNYLAGFIRKIQELGSRNGLIITGTEAEAAEMVTDLSIFHDNVLLFPWWGTMVYKGVSPQASVFGNRVNTLFSIMEEKETLYVASLRSFLSYLPPRKYLEDLKIDLRIGDSLDPVFLEKKLQEFGYLRVPRVTVAGEFALRGEVLDVFMPGDKDAVRVVFEFEDIEVIKYFDPVSQSSGDKKKNLTLYPTKEVIWDEELISTLENNFEEALEACEILRTTGEFRGEELFYPLAFDKPATLLDYFSDDDLVFMVDTESLSSGEKHLINEYDELYLQAVDQELTVPEPGRIHNSLDNILPLHRKLFKIHNLTQDENKESILFNCDPGHSFFGNINYLKEEMQEYRDRNMQIYIFAESESQSDRIGYMLREYEPVMIPHSISSGFALPDNNIIVIQENEIFGRRKKVPSSVKKSKSEVIDSFVELNPGDYVVHVNYGIGLFKGIERIRAAGNERDYIALKYAAGDTIFVPIEQVNLVQRYIGQESRNPRLDKIGGKTWDNKKKKVRKSVEDLADRLITLYAGRQTAQGYSFPRDDDFQVEFEASFPYQETKDQLQAVEEIKGDMESPRPMDRLVCGDVGYGKTEIAMRAAFKGVMGGRQVAFLCPTTILAEQHYENFLERFKRFPIRIAMLSRFVKKADQKGVLKRLEAGEIDLLIGTHRILSKDIRFKNLGLMIIDEEQRFGVKDKEKLKEIKTNIDCLTLSATPIPRTLHMSMVKIRDMSVLKTAPKNRQPIETLIQEFDPGTVSRAIRREIERGGQVFFLHNRVESLESIQVFLQDLVPEVFVEIAHGKMSSRELEEIMHRFISGAFQVLVSTTIIENGIDIPNVNTIIIDRADMYGISQLYQLRGRVGRSERLAYAYLLYPESKALTDLAMKRLQIISDFTDLGSGFKIAMKDMEVRGAGNLLGSEQSGEIMAVGFDMYLRLLEDAVKERSEGEKEEEAPDVYLELDYTGFIPETYINDPTEKMEVYKKIASITDKSEQEKIFAELYDRFGPLPSEVQSLMAMSEIRIICKQLWISNLKERKGLVYIDFGKVAVISVDKVMKLITTSRGIVKLSPAHPERMIIETGKIGLEEKSEFLKEKLSVLL